MATASAATVTVGQGTAGKLSIPGIISTMDLSPQNGNSVYAETADVTFASVVSTTGSQVQVTLAACTANCPNIRQGTSKNNPGLPFNPSASLTDLAPAPNTATGTVDLGGISLF
jgi:hypothetical protein